RRPYRADGTARDACSRWQKRRKDRRLYARAAPLPWLWAGVVREAAPGVLPHAGECRPAFARALSGERRDAEHAGIPAGMGLQSGTANGAAKRLQGVVGSCRTVSSSGWNPPYSITNGP